MSKLTVQNKGTSSKTVAKTRNNVNSLAMETKLMEERLLHLKEQLMKDQSMRSNIPKNGIWRSAKRAWEATEKPGSASSSKRSTSSKGGEQVVSTRVQSASLKQQQPVFKTLTKPQAPPAFTTREYAVVTKPIDNSEYEELIPAPKSKVLKDLASYYDDEELEESQSQGGGALWGTYDEEANKNSFKEALENWRTINSPSEDQQQQPPPQITSTEMEIQTSVPSAISAHTKPVPFSEQFTQSLRDCVRRSYFDQLESYLKASSSGFCEDD